MHKVERIKGELFEEKRPGLDILLLGLGGNGVDHTDDDGRSSLAASDLLSKFVIDRPISENRSASAVSIPISTTRRAARNGQVRGAWDANRK